MRCPPLDERDLPTEGRTVAIEKRVPPTDERTVPWATNAILRRRDGVSPFDLGARAKEGIMRCMKAIKVDTTVDETVAVAIPALRPLLGKRVERIALGESPAIAPGRRLTVDELMGSRIKSPSGAAPLPADDIERAIAEGALGR